MMERLTGTTGNTALLLIAALCCLGAGISYLAAVRAKKLEKVERRVQSFDRTGTVALAKPALPKALSLEKPETDTMLADHAPSFPISIGRLQRQKNLRRRLLQAGLNPKAMLLPFHAAQALCFVLGGIGSFAALQGFLSSANDIGMTAVAAIFAGFAAGSAPNFLLIYRIRQRQQLIERAVPDMIDLLILCVEAGLTLEVALGRAIEGLEPFAPELCLEMKMTLSELRILPDKSMALTNLERRTASKSLKYLVLALRQSERYGTSITGALGAVAAENRKHAILKLENNAARMPALLSAPLIGFILPPVVALSAGPGFVLMMRAIGG
jgi:tight adherence protein C